MRLLAISDLHLASDASFERIEALPAYPEDWLILGGDIAESADGLDRAFTALAGKFARLIWVPGNHELWTRARSPAAPRGVERYESLVALARRHGVTTPEDPYPIWPGPGGEHVIAPLFLLYDYSFRPPDLPLEEVVAWAAEESAVCADELLLYPDPYPTRQEWCRARIAATAERLAALPARLPMVLVNHHPLRRDLVRIPRIPRFSPWCGTTLTEEWHTRFRARVVVSGHLHVRHTDWRDGTRFEEVSLGYPYQWEQHYGVAAYLREILPGPVSPGPGAPPAGERAGPR
ncbi:putative phosphodiesterase [Inquilinus ginsengisoli]|uniref:Phosphodiesterase n=1 Tax=Inquilinus ginsengisoli TaxID=363840 RepID=A0ABU1JKX4_9PROT|nr:metallophosphoesterase [Inquilinus ginsengisoli]MDR6289263.1 putative phosphodiesterase [Inquilinus ginsengisoli]